MHFQDIFQNISAGILVTDADFKVIWANKFEEDYYHLPLEEMIGLKVVDCHKKENRAKIRGFLEKFKTGELKEFTKIAMGMVITYSSYFVKGEFAGIVRTRIKMPA
jgi:PAS domain S-box-containing protein